MSKAHVEELLRAKERIASGDKCYICDALRKSNQSTGIWSPAAREIKDQIERDLDYAFSLTYWLRNQGYISFEDNDDKEAIKINRSPKMIATRLAWIDALIEYWQDR